MEAERKRMTLFLHSECIRSLCVQIRCVLPFLLFPAKERETPACSGCGFLCLGTRVSFEKTPRRLWMIPFAAEHEDLATCCKVECRYRSK